MYMIFNVLSSLQSNEAHVPAVSLAEQFSLSLTSKEKNSFIKFLEKIAEVPAFPWHCIDAVRVLFEKWRVMHAEAETNGKMLVMGKHKAWQCDVKTNLAQLLVLFFHKATALPTTNKAWLEVFSYLPTDTQAAWEYLHLVKQVSYALDKTAHYDFLLGTPAHYTQNVTSHFNLLYASKHLQAFERIGISRERLTNFALAYKDEEMDWFLRNFLCVFGFLPAPSAEVTLFWDKCMYLVGAYKGNPKKFYGKNAHKFGLDLGEQKKLAETHEITDMLDFVGKFAEDVRVFLGYIWVCNSWGVPEIYKNTAEKTRQVSLADAWWGTLGQKDTLEYELRTVQELMRVHGWEEIPYDLGICLKIKHFGILPAYREVSQDKAMLENPFSYFFTKYGLSKGLLDYFFDHRNDVSALDLQFFEHIAEGNNPATFLVGEMPILNKKEAHCLMTMQIDSAYTTLLNLVLKAKIQAKGFVNQDVCLTLVQAIRNFSFTPESYAFVDMFLNFLVKYQSEAYYPFYRYLGNIYYYLLHTAQEQGDAFTMKGRTLEAILRQSEEWHATFRIGGYYNYEFLSWARGAVEDSIVEVGEVSYKFEELLTSKLLFEESAALGHCVRGYFSSCCRGNCRIWGVRTKTEKLWKPTLIPK
jgi:hypothetical protein